MENKEILEAQVKIGSVLQRSTPAFKKLIGKSLDRFLVAIDKEIADYLKQFGIYLVEKIKEEMYKSTGTGRTYTYVDEGGEIVDKENASAEFRPPGVFQSNLINSLEYRIERWSGRVKIGVYDPGFGDQYATIAYYKKYKMPDGTWLNDVVIVGPSGQKTPIKEYARMLEEEQNRPFLHNLVFNYSQEIKDELKKELRQNISDKMFRGKKPPVFFRIYPK